MCLFSFFLSLSPSRFLCVRRTLAQLFLSFVFFYLYLVFEVVQRLERRVMLEHDDIIFLFSSSSTKKNKDQSLKDSIFLLRINIDSRRISLTIATAVASSNNSSTNNNKNEGFFFSRSFVLRFNQIHWKINRFIGLYLSDRRILQKQV